MMEIKLVDQPPKCDMSLENFINKNAAELVGTVQPVKICYFDRDIFQVNNFVRCYRLFLEFLNPEFENEIVYYEIIGFNYPKYTIKINNTNKDYDFFNSLFINDGLIDEFNNCAFIVHIGQLANYLTNNRFKIDGSELVKNDKIIVVSGD